LGNVSVGWSETKFKLFSEAKGWIPSAISGRQPQVSPQVKWSTGVRQAKTNESWTISWGLHCLVIDEDFLSSRKRICFPEFVTPTLRGGAAGPVRRARQHVRSLKVQWFFHYRGYGKERPSPDGHSCTRINFQRVSD